MKYLINRFRWIGILLGVLLILAGILIAVLAILDMINGNSYSTNAITISAAVICFVVGLVFIVAGLLTPLTNFFDPAFLLGSLAVGAGVVLLVLLGKDDVSIIIICLTAVTLLTLGAIYLIRGIMATFYRVRLSKVILAYIVSTLAIVAGILSIFLQKELQNVIYLLLGAAIVVAGVMELITVIKMKKGF